MASGVLVGSGVINGAVNVLPAGILSPGASIDSLTIKRSLTNSGTLLMELNKSGPALTNDTIRGLDTLTCDGTLELTVTGDSLAPGDSFHLFDAANYTGVFMNIIPSSPGPGQFWDISTLAVDGTLRVKSVPGPIIAFVMLDLGNLVFSGSNGAAAAQYCVLGSTNLAAPRASWTRTLTNAFEPDGRFMVTNSILTGASRMFFLIESQ